MVRKLNEVKLKPDKKGSQRGIETRHARLYFHDMLKAMYYCHRVVGVVHKDIKPDNIVIGDNHEAVLIDFGVSAMYDKENDSE